MLDCTRVLCSRYYISLLSYLFLSENYSIHYYELFVTFSSAKHRNEWCRNSICKFSSVSTVLGVWGRARIILNKERQWCCNRGGLWWTWRLILCQRCDANFPINRDFAIDYSWAYSFLSSLFCNLKLLMTRWNKQFYYTRNNQEFTKVSLWFFLTRN